VSAASFRDGIVAGAYSAEVALATKAGSHSHKGGISLPSRMPQRAITCFLFIQALPQKKLIFGYC
jgi:hypothetical protein